MSAVLGVGGNSRPSGSKLDLINATLSAISRHGLSALTSAKIAGMAGHTAASINFHFGSKEALLLATLREVSEEFAEALEAGLANAGDDPLRGLQAIIEASLSPQLSDSRKVAVWYAFLGESNAREDYQRICGDRDNAYGQSVARLCEQVVAARSDKPRPDPQAIALGLVGLIDQLWQSILFVGDEYDREAAKRQCNAYLASVFPWLEGRIQAGSGSPATAAGPSRPEPTGKPGLPGLRYTLPAWTYRNAEFLELEKEHLLMPSWQIACHVSELKRTGDYVAFEFFGERGFVIRDEAGTLRAFHNVCAHRAHAVVTGRSGHCPKFLACPYHGWTYHLDGRNRSVSAPDTFPRFDRSGFGLKPIELEQFMGLVFVRFRGGEPGVAQRLEPYRAELAHYRIEDMVPLDEGWEQTHDIDWKNVVENYVEDYHFPMGHPGLSALMEQEYDREVTPTGAMRLSHRMRREPLRSWSAERYAAIQPAVAHLPPDLQRRWSYFGLFPNVFFDVYPEWLDYFQVIPEAAGKVRLRARTYGFPDERREMRAARFLSVRINARVQAEDNLLTRSVQQGLASSAYSRGILSDKEVVLGGFQDWIRARLPVTRLTTEPARGSVADRNRALGS
jgi:phenylpropionate dioxygenase-like ring-hydroxylating dioxygenase large terminal subunit/AcrR family transcriptional regulator